LTAKRAIIDTVNSELILCGPGGCQLIPSPGSERFKLKRAPSGHLLLPVSDFKRAVAKTANSHNADIALLAGFKTSPSGNPQN
jgi:hypothetical protein